MRTAPRLSLAGLPAALAILLVLLSGLYDGAFDVRHWGPAAVFCLVLLAAMLVSGGGRRLSRPLLVAVLAIWAFAAWSLLSMTWAESPALAWDGANRSILYAALVTIAVTALPTEREMRALGALLIAAVAVLGLITLIRMHVQGTDLFVAGRLDTPFGYRNATACMFALAFWALLGAAVTRGRNPTLRAGAFSAAVLMLGLAFLTQSRGVILGLLLGGAVALALGRERIRRAFLALLALGGVLLLSGPLLTAYRAFENAQGTVTSESVARATGALTFLVVDAFIVGLLLALLDGGLRASIQNLQRARRIAVIGLVAGSVGLVVGGVAAAGDPIAFAQDKLGELEAVENRSSEVTRILSTGGERSDLWRVALDEFRAAPIRGVGEDNYAFVYYAQRGSDRNLSDPHSLPLSILAETGVVGALLFGTFVVAIGVAIVGRVRGAPLGTRHAVAGLAAGGAVVLGQALVDWIWLIPAVTGTGLFCLALAAAILSSPPGPSRPSGRRRFALARALPATVMVAAVASVLVVFGSDHYMREARAAASPEAALAAASTAALLNPFAVSPPQAQAAALERLGDRVAARAQLDRALAREPRNFTTLALLGDLEMRAGDEPLAREYYGRALELNPRDRGLEALAGTPRRASAAR